jgi:hypothetical protein
VHVFYRDKEKLKWVSLAFFVRRFTLFIVRKARIVTNKCCSIKLLQMNGCDIHMGTELSAGSGMKLQKPESKTMQ